MNLKIYQYENLSPSELLTLIARPPLYTDDEKRKVAKIIEDLKSDGDKSLLRYTKQFDGAALNAIEATVEEWEEALSKVSDESWQALKCAAKNIERFHRLQTPQPISVETTNGVLCKREWRALKRVGLYAPGGNTPLISTVLMLSIPARIAGCEEIILCTPPDASGAVKPEMFAAAKTGGVQKIFKAGGAQAIGAMAIGTASIPKVNKIFGPGNRFVAAAKSIVSSDPFYTAIDMVAGPSELMLIADQNARPDWIAADLLTQTEHGSDSQVIFISTSRDVIHSVNNALEALLQKLPRKELSLRSLERSFAIEVKSMIEAVEIANLYAPEHLMICTANAESLAESIRNAGSVFLGYQASVVFGDYISGTNHTLPTGGTAIYRGGLCVEDFMKPVTFQAVSNDGAASIAKHAAALARLEGLEAHARAAELRKTSNNETAASAHRSIDQLVRKQFLSFTPYASARSESVNGSVFLDANELASHDDARKYGPVVLNRYPDTNCIELRSELAKWNGLSVESVCAGNGSDEIIDLLIRLFCEPAKDAIVILQPTYGVYEVAARVHGSGVIELDLDNDFQFHAGEILDRLPQSAKILFCCSPNNPTGNLLDPNEIQKLAELFPGIVVVDEAYIEFSSADSLAKNAAASENLVVLRTLSKAWGLAGIRLGYCIASSRIISYLMRIKPPYNISSISLYEAIQSLQTPGTKAKHVREVIQERERTKNELRKLRCVLRVFESDANFLLIRFRDSKTAYDRLLQDGIVVRRRNEERLKDCLRITIGTPHENDLVLKTLSEL